MWLKCSQYSKKKCFSLTQTPKNENLFQFPLKVRGRGERKEKNKRDKGEAVPVLNKN